MWEEICLKCGRKSARQQSRNLETAATPLRLALASEKVFGPCSLYSGIEGWKKTLKSASSLFSNCLVSWTFCFVSETFSLFSFSSLFGTSASNSGSRRPSTSHDANRPKLLVYFLYLSLPSPWQHSNWSCSQFGNLVLPAVHRANPTGLTWSYSQICFLLTTKFSLRVNWEILCHLLALESPHLLVLKGYPLSQCAPP